METTYLYRFPDSEAMSRLATVKVSWFLFFKMFGMAQSLIDSGQIDRDRNEEKEREKGFACFQRLAT